MVESKRGESTLPISEVAASFLTNTRITCLIVVNSTNIHLVPLQEGNADAGRYQLETAISTYRSQTGLLGSDTVLAGYHLKLGRCVRAWVCVVG